jgi:limonene-1,2-epoxide hydrolase
MKLSTRRIAVATASLAVAATAFTSAAPALAVTPTTGQAAPSATRHGIPKIAQDWAGAWNSTSSTKLADLFTKNGVYIDYGVNKTSTGRDQIIAWKAGTNQLIADVNVNVLNAFRSGNNVAIETIYSGHIYGAPSGFAVHSTTILELSKGKIAVNKDNYSLTTLLAQSGLPADWTPPTGS